MKKFNKSKLLVAIMLTVISSAALAITMNPAETQQVNTEQSSINNSVVQKHSPEVTLDLVQEIFGHNLDTQDATLKTLLLAIGMDHTTNGSPNAESAIGIPFIVDRGPKYWVTRLVKKDYEVEVLVNNALLLLFSKEELPNAQEAADDLMLTAANKGYWPASYYIAERNLTTFLSKDFIKEGPSFAELKPEKFLAIAKDTMNRYNECAGIGFAPCQYRIGFWLANTEKSLTDGLNVLREAINTTMSDSRYSGVLDGGIVRASELIVFKGEEAGLDYVVREQYAKLIQAQLGQYSEDIKQAKEEQQAD